jgi:3alpha(or 20beta)-hydroxysteroid dehydrogenase
MGRLNGKVAIVTGSARGAGAVIARVFVSEGAQVVLVDILDDRGQRVADELGKAARYVHCDIAEESDWARAVAVALEEFGSVNVLVNNAAILHVAPLDQTSVEDFMRIQRVNTMGTFLGVRSVVEPMKAAGGGAIINITSISSLEGTPRCVAYVASKWAIRGITRTAAMELGPYGIRVIALNPCAANPEMVEPFLPPGTSVARLAAAWRHPLVHRETHEEALVANARNVVFFASDEAAYFTGVDVDPSSGWTATYGPPEAYEPPQ